MLKDKVIIVTGAGSGIGLATATLLAEAGAKVVVSGRESDRLATVVDQIRQGGDTAIVVAADVSQEAEVAALVDRAVSEFGRLDGAFNNAGVEMHNKLVPDLTSKDWNALFGGPVAAEPKLRLRSRDEPIA